MEKVRLDKMLYVAPDLSRPMPNPRNSLADRPEPVRRQMIFVDHDASQARDVAEAAEILAEETSTAVAGLAQRLERCGLRHSGPSGALPSRRGILPLLIY